MDAKTRAYISTLMSQRNNALDAIAELNGALAEREAQLDALQTKLEMTKAESPAPSAETP